MLTPFFSRTLLAGAAATALLCTPTHANDEGPGVHAATAKKPATKKPEAIPPAAAAAAAVAAPEPVAAAAAPAGRELRERKDPLDIVRERLAEKLGVGRAASTSGSGVIRVLSSPAATPPTVAALAVSAPRSVKASSANTGAAKAAADAHRASLADGHSGAPHAPHWDYQGESGPQAWAQLKNEFAVCGTGKRQSPIDIRDGIKVQLDSVQFDYRSSSFRVLDNGHTVQVNVSAGNYIEVTGKRFELVQFHFHRPSEERVNGRLFDMVAHLVHKDIEGRLAVVAVLLDRGNAQPLVQAIWNNLPLEKGDEVSARLPLDLNDLLPTDRSYYTYMGSLTTPPCSEGVLWMVMKSPVTLSVEQIAIFARLYPMNARPIQSASGRLIKESN